MVGILGKRIVQLGRSSAGNVLHQLGHLHVVSEKFLGAVKHMILPLFTSFKFVSSKNLLLQTHIIGRLSTLISLRRRHDLD